MAIPAQTDPQFKLRMTKRVKSIVEQAAASNSRSMNAEILWRLENYEQRLADIRWLKEEMERLRQERDIAERVTRADVLNNADAALEQMLPNSLFKRVHNSASKHNRSLLEEVTLALEATFPPPTADQLIDVWETLLRPFFNFHEPDAPEAKKQQQTIEANIRTMIDFFKAERDAGRGGDLEARYRAQYEIGPDGLARKKKG